MRNRRKFADIEDSWHVETGVDAIPGGIVGYIAFYDKESGERAGYIDYGYTPRQAYVPEDILDIKYVYVKPEYRRQGVATQLLEALLEKYPGVPVDPGMSTPEGDAWLQTVDLPEPTVQHQTGSDDPMEMSNEEIAEAIHALTGDEDVMYWDDLAHEVRIRNLGEALYQRAYRFAPWEVDSYSASRRTALERRYVFSDPETYWTSNDIVVLVNLVAEKFDSPFVLSYKEFDNAWPPEDLHRTIDDAIDEAEHSSTWDIPVVQKIQEYFDHRLVVEIRSRGKQKIIGVLHDIHDPILDEPTEVDDRHTGVSEKVWRAYTFGDNEDLLRAILNDVFDLGLPEQFHTMLNEKQEVVEVYRGITLEDDDVDPIDAARSDGGIGTSWTLDLRAAQGIAEFGQAGFNKGNVYGTGIIQGEVRRLLDGEVKVRWPERRIVLRAEVTLDQENAHLLLGPYSYAPEEEISFDRGTPIQVTGIMEAELEEAAPGEIDRVVEEIQEEEGFREPFGVRVIWPDDFDEVRVERQAKRHGLR